MTAPVKERKDKVNEEPVNETDYQVEEEKQIIFHCRFDAPGNEDALIRIWPTTYLIDRASDYKSDLLFAYNISFYPVWDLIPVNSTKKFTLVFGGLPKSCKVFDLVEITNNWDGFTSKGIVRKKEDVYTVKF
jgi:hypothetical protein